LAGALEEAGVSEKMRLKRLDGVRAIAILLVILLHQAYISFGWAGVDLFFVLSGFLITQILRKTKSETNYWSRFYIRRAARILPPLLLLMVLFCVSTRHIHWPTVLGYTFFAGNLMNVLGRGISVLAPLWSLAVEEHFYLVWPFIVLTFNRKTLISILIGILLIEPALRMFALSHIHRSVVELTPFRMDGIAAGSLLALLSESKATFRRAGWATLILTIVFLAVPHSTQDMNSPLLLSLVAAIGFCFVAWVMTLQQGLAYNLLSSGPMSYIGRISYGMYLLNLPIISLGQRLVHSGFDEAIIRRMFPVDIAIMIALASLSYYLIEQPIIRFARMRSELMVDQHEVMADG
jgi:peptidoglycan/LPS O-acetylase OafA/YrhL